jgi:hypothetical protein
LKFICEERLSQFALNCIMRHCNEAVKALHRVIENIAESRSHMPYRDSKLTRLLACNLVRRCRMTPGCPRFVLRSKLDFDQPP